jgi:hypothetical protein
MFLEERTLAPHCVHSTIQINKIRAVQCGVETTSFRKFFVFLQLVSLDTADEHRLLDQRNILEENYQAAKLETRKKEICPIVP